MIDKPATRAVRAGIDSDLNHGAVIPPITLSATFRFDTLDEKPPYDYTRCGNPTRTGALDALRAMGAGAEVIPKGDRGGEPVGTLEATAARAVAPTPAHPRPDLQPVLPEGYRARMGAILPAASGAS